MKRHILNTIVASLRLNAVGQRVWAYVSSVALCFALNATAQTGVTSNLHEHIILYKAGSTGTVKFTLAPEDPAVVSRSHWPIVFIDFNNDGLNIRQMFNLTYEREFTVNVNNGDGKILITGENGTWKLISSSQDLKNSDLHYASALRYVDLSKNKLGDGTSTTTENANGGVFTFADENNQLETVNLSTNKLTDVKFGGSTPYYAVKEFSASENLIPTYDFSLWTNLSYADLSKNLLTSIKTPAAPNVWASSWTVFKGGNLTAYQTAYNSGAPSSATAAVLYQPKGGSNPLKPTLNLTVNKLDIFSLPELPTGVAAANYYYTLQERPTVPQTSRGDYKYRMFEEIDLSRQISTKGVLGTTTNTQYVAYREDNAATDVYYEIPANEYEITGGKIKFKRAYGEEANIFIAMKNTALPYPLESFERGTGSITTHGFDQVLAQPSGTISPDKDTYMTNVVAATMNNVGDGLNGRTLPTQFFRTNTFKLLGGYKNYWYGFNSNDWGTADNWTGRFIPKSETTTEYTASTVVPVADKELYSVEFASLTNDYQESAIRDLHTDKDRRIYDYINKSENGKAMVVRPDETLYLMNDYTFAAATNGPNKASSDYSYRTVLKAEQGRKNASFLAPQLAANYGGASSKEYPATVEMFSKGKDGNRNKQAAIWQYFGIPVKGTTTGKTRDEHFAAEDWVRIYDVTKTNDFDEKWNELASTSEIAPGKAYEVTHPQPKKFAFRGNLNFRMDNATVTLPAGGPTDQYQNMPMWSNPFTAAMDISKLTFTGVEETVYLFNTGSRQDWIDNSGNTTNGSLPGQYIAIPKALAGTGGLPQDIPSMSVFMAKATTGATTAQIGYQYSNLFSNKSANRVRRRGNILSVDVASTASADRVWLFEVPETSKSYDAGYDGEKLFAANAAQLYVMSDRSYQVASAADIDDTELGFVAGDAAKSYQLKFHLDEENSGEEYYLLDRLTRTHTQIYNGLTYDFSATAEQPANRFAITRKRSVDTDDTFVGKGIELRAKANRTIEARNFTDEEAKVEVFDLAGKVVEKFTVDAKNKHEVQLPLEGVFVVRANNSQAKVTQRFIVK